MTANVSLVNPATTASTAVFDGGTYTSITATADALATTETVDIKILAGATYKTYTNAAGTAVKLTATAPTQTIPGGCIYKFEKSTTAAACGIYVNLV